ncbi:MAG: glycosyltransferase, partial [Bacteriovoracaceae bacterium]|nr:glycosyltransferase [Bacteriovoracaceae bacterium]
MKIVHICQFLGVGGLERVLLSLCQEQLKRGDSVELVVYDTDRRWVQKFDQAGVEVHQDYQKAPGYDFGLLSYLEKRTLNADIVHTHDLNPALYLAPLRIIHALKLKRRPVTFLHTTHGMEHLDLAPKTKLYEAFIGMISPKIVTVSPKFLDYYQSQPLTRSSKVHHINNGTQL